MKEENSYSYIYTHKGSYGTERGTGHRWPDTGGVGPTGPRVTRVRGDTKWGGVTPLESLSPKGSTVSWSLHVNSASQDLTEQNRWWTTKIYTQEVYRRTDLELFRCVLDHRIDASLPKKGKEKGNFDGHQRGFATSTLVPTHAT